MEQSNFGNERFLQNNADCVGKGRGSQNKAKILVFYPNPPSLYGVPLSSQMQIQIIFVCKKNTNFSAAGSRVFSWQAVEETLLKT